MALPGLANRIEPENFKENIMSGCGRLMGQDYVCGDGILCEQCQRIAALEAELAKARTDNFVLRQNSVDMAVWQDEHRKRMEAEKERARLYSMLNVEADKAVEKVLSMTSAQLEATYQEQGRCANCATNECKAAAMTAIARVRRETAEELEAECERLREELKDADELLIIAHMHGYEDEKEGLKADNARLRALVGEMLPHTRYVRKLQKVHYLDTTDIDNLIARTGAEGE